MSTLYNYLIIKYEKNFTSIVDDFLIFVNKKGKKRLYSFLILVNFTINLMLIFLTNI